MKVEILDVKGDEVRFSCSIGDGAGICKERNLVVGMSCDVEIDIFEILETRVNTEIGKDKLLFWHYNGGVNMINAKVESIDIDDSICLRLAKDFIVMVDYVARGISVGDVLLIKVKLSEVAITLTGV